MKPAIAADTLVGCDIIYKDVPLFAWQDNLYWLNESMKRINIGCGRSPVQGWSNYDNSMSPWLARHGVLTGLFNILGLLNAANRRFIEFAKSAHIQWADAAKRIPEVDDSVDVVYSSHMLEHLDKIDRDRFLREAYRVLCPGGILRLAVPDIRFLVNNYLADNDADKFIAETLLTCEKPRTFTARLRSLFVGHRDHYWMYDGESLCKLLLSAGFVDPQVMEAGKTRIADPGELNLSEQAPLSVFVEAVKPASPDHQSAKDGNENEDGKQDRD